MTDHLYLLIGRWTIFASGVAATYSNDIIGVIILFIVLFVCDFITGCLKSFRQGIPIESSKLRWSFVKTICYIGTFGLTVFVGICLDQIEVFYNIAKLEVFIAIWIEACSNCENCMVIFPEVEFFRVMNFMLSTVWVKKISGMMDYLKEKKHKDLNNKEK